MDRNEFQENREKIVSRDRENDLSDLGGNVSDPASDLSDLGGTPITDTFIGGLTTNLPTKGVGAAIGRGLLPGVGGAAGGIMAAGAALPSGPGAVGAAMLGSGAGSAVGETARQGVVRFRDALEHRKPTPAAEAGKSIAKEGAIGFATGAVPFAAKQVTKRLSGLLGNVGSDSFERLVERPREVLDSISSGASAKEAGQHFIEAVKENLSRAGDAYEKLIDKVTGSAYARQRYDVARGIGDKVEKITEKYGYGMKGRIGKESTEASKFLKVSKALKGRSVTAKELYYLQRDIGNMARDAGDTTLGSALGEVKSEIRTFLGGKIKEVGQANKIYSKAKGLADLADKRFANRMNLPQDIKNAYRSDSKLKDFANKIADEVPKARKELENLLDAKAAEDFAAPLAPLPRTGLAAGVGALGLRAAEGNPLATGAAVLTAPFLSPRLTAEAVGRTAQAAPALKPIFRVTAPSLSDFYNQE